MSNKQQHSSESSYCKVLFSASYSAFAASISFAALGWDKYRR